METVIAHKCSFCGKLYDREESCVNHERKCYFNPKTKSCASCSFLRVFDMQYKKDHIVRHQVCILNKDIYCKLQTRCKTYLNKEHSDKDIEKVVLESFDPKAALSKIVKKLKLDKSCI